VKRRIAARDIEEARAEARADCGVLTGAAAADLATYGDDKAPPSRPSACLRLNVMTLPQVASPPKVED
jgi:hypothetical protein